MTWNEFKRIVEEAGVQGDDQIAYIDLGDYTPEAHWEDDGSFSVA